MRYLMVPLWIAMILAARCVPHLANFSPVISLSLFAGIVFHKRIGMLVLLAALLLSDVLLAYLHGYMVFGVWTSFVYSGLIATMLLGSRLQVSNRFSRYFLCSLGSCVGFWLWTNVSSWWMMYAHNVAGLMQCYVAALPFLQRSLVGTLVSLPILYAVLRSTHSPVIANTLSRHCER